MLLIPLKTSRKQKNLVYRCQDGAVFAHHSRNITAQNNAVGSYGSKRTGRDICKFDQNLYWNFSGQPVLFGQRTLTEWQALGQDTDSLIADPLFADPKKGDFRLPPASRASKIGFEPWDFTAVGPRPPCSPTECSTR